MKTFLFLDWISFYLTDVKDYCMVYQKHLNMSEVSNTALHKANNFSYS